MEGLDFRAFFNSIEPFSGLKSNELDLILESVDTYYFRKDAFVLRKNDALHSYFVIVKGLIKESGESGEFFYGAKDSFCAKSIFAGTAVSSFIACEECIIFGIKHEIFMEFFSKNENFKNYYLNSISQRIEGFITDAQSSENAVFGLSRVKDIFIHKALSTKFTTTIIDTAKMMSENDSDFIIINFDDSYGIVTNTSLREKVILGGISSDEVVGKISTKHLVCIDENELLSSALILMLEHSISRLGVTKNGLIIGVLEQADILSANRAYLANMRIAKAKDKKELEILSQNQEESVKSLYKAGLNVKNIAKFVSDTNVKIYKRAAELIFKDKLLSCIALTVTGSEGRKEQILRTDQDNILILDDEIDLILNRKNLYNLCKEFTQTLISFGFKECDGGIMVSNPKYCKTFTQYKKEIGELIVNPTGENCMQISIFADIAFVCGKEELVYKIKNAIFSQLQLNPRFLPHFSKQIMNFETPLSVFSNFITEKDGLDIKKGAIFPIIHGIRALALEKNIHDANTILRVKRLCEDGFFDESFANELSEAFLFLMSLRFESNLNRAKNSTSNNLIEPKTLSKFQRDLLRDTLKLTNEFKKRLSYHFGLGSLL